MEPKVVSLALLHLTQFPGVCAAAGDVATAKWLPDTKASTDT